MTASLRKKFPEDKIPDLVLLQHHEVEVLNAFLRVLPHPLSKGRLAHNITNVLVDEAIPS